MTSPRALRLRSPVALAVTSAVAVSLVLAVGSFHPAAGTAAPVNLVIDLAAGHRTISPLIYGINGDVALDFPQSSAGGLADVLSRTRTTLLRLGGNRWTAYNWENNASNAGADWLYQNDDYLSASSTPGAAVDSTITAAQAAGAATIVTVPIGGYVAADTSPGGDVRNSGPSYLTTRFRQNNSSGGALSTTPNFGDGQVYQNQFVYWLTQAHPSADVRYELDNEPNDWNSTHAEINAANLTYSQLVARNLEYAAAIKAVTPTAKVGGPVLDGWQGQEDPVNSDGSSADYQAHGRFLDYYLRQLKTADTSAGHRIIDTLDLHWYPQVTPSLFNTDHGPAVVAAREQAPRSLWDPTYVGNSWITMYSTGGQAINLLPRVQQEIANLNPGMGLAISEWNYGGGQDISGGIATADTLGIFGRQGVGSAAFWPEFSPNEDWSYGAFAAFRNYDGRGAAFGDTAVQVNDSDPVNTSAYASTDSANPGRTVIVVINKNLTAQAATVQINGSTARTATVYTLTGASPLPQPANGLAANSPGTFAYTMPAQSVSIIVPAAGDPGVPAPPTDPAPGDDSPPVSAPGPVRSLRARYGRARANVRWDPPAAIGGAPITRYEYRTAKVAHNRRAAFGWTRWRSVGTARTVLISREVKIRYRVCVRAVNAIGAGPGTTLGLAVRAK